MKQLLLVALSCGASLGSAVQLPSALPDSLQQQQVATLLAQADTLLSNALESRRALALYSEALSLNRRSPEILWRISQSYVDIADNLGADERELKLSMYEKALEFADKSVHADRGNSMALTRRAIARARVALFKGFWESIGLMKETREDLENALSADSTNHEAHFALGSTHLKVIEKPWILRWPLGLGWGDREEAINHFERAIELRWDRIEYRLAAARLYIEDDEHAKARAHLSLIPMLRAVNRTDLVARQEAHVLLEKIDAEH
ncbi:MAG: hypothetical protein HY563_07080 [Ignavibacteriales bacterium]|nr:hypothetical protein [Ignavibacteriales bacterium]